MVVIDNSGSMNMMVWHPDFNPAVPSTLQRLHVRHLLQLDEQVLHGVRKDADDLLRSGRHRGGQLDALGQGLPELDLVAAERRPASRRDQRARQRDLLAVPPGPGLHDLLEVPPRARHRREGRAARGDLQHQHGEPRALRARRVPAARRLERPERRLRARPGQGLQRADLLARAEERLLHRHPPAADGSARSTRWRARAGRRSARRCSRSTRTS